jgi:hypothetical protein
METKEKNEKPVKEFLKAKVKSTIATSHITPHVHSSGTIEENNFIGHSRNSHKQHYFQGSRD